MDKILGSLEKVLPLLAFYPRWVQAVFVFGLMVVLSICFLFVVFYPSASKNKQGFVSDGSLPELTLAGRMFKRDYVIESAMMTVRLDAVIEAEPSRAADVSIVYTIFALNSVTNFDEEFHTMQANAVIYRVNGSHPERTLKSPRQQEKHIMSSCGFLPALAKHS